MLSGLNRCFLAKWVPRAAEVVVVQVSTAKELMARRRVQEKEEVAPRSLNRPEMDIGRTVLTTQRVRVVQ